MAAAAAATGSRVAHFTVTLTDDTLIPSVRAYMVLAALGEHGELVGAVPHQDDVESFDGRVVQAWLVSEHEDEAALTTDKGVPDVAAVVAAELAAPAPPLRRPPPRAPPGRPPPRRRRSRSWPSLSPGPRPSRSPRASRSRPARPP